MANVVSVHEVRQLLPMLIEQTEKTQQILEKGSQIMQGVMLPENEFEMIENDLNDLYKLWVKFVGLHNGIVKDRWIVEFDDGSGFIHWNHEQKHTLFFRGYTSEASDLIPL